MAEKQSVVLRAQGATRSPLVAFVVSVLEERVRANVYPNGQRLPSERDLGSEFGVSRAVIRAALDAMAERGLIARSSRCRPLVQANAPAVLRSTAARHTLALWLIHRPTDAEAPALLYGVQHALDQDNYRLVVGNPMGNNWDAVTVSEGQFLQQITEDQDIAGAILWYIGGETNRPALKRVREAGIPLVFLDRRPPHGFPADHVGVDNEFSAESAVNHLVAVGHRSIAHVTNIDRASTVAERSAGYRRGLARAGIEFREDLVVAATGSDADLEWDCRGIVDRLMSVENPPTAIFVVNDRLAIGIVDALRLCGRQVPADVAVAGFDGIERWMTGPRTLTTCNQPFERIGARAVDLLLRRIHEDPNAPFREVLLEAPLSVHSSTLAQQASEKVLQLSQS